MTFFPSLEPSETEPSEPVAGDKTCVGSVPVRAGCDSGRSIDFRSDSWRRGSRIIIMGRAVWVVSAIVWSKVPAFVGYS